MDLAIVDWYRFTVNIFLGLGNGTFLNQMILSFENEIFTVSISIADFNNDGKLDVAFLDLMSLDIYIILSSCDCCGRPTMQEHIDTQQ